MPAYFDAGFCVRTPSWHRQENLLAEAPTTWEEAGRLSGLGLWEPRKEYLYDAPVYMFRIGDNDEMLAGFPEGSKIVHEDEAGVTVLPAVTTHRRVERNDDGRKLGIVGRDFELVPHSVMGEIMEAMMASDPALRYDTAGSAKDGAIVWVVAYLDEPTLIARDDSPTLPFVSVLNAHDGSASCRLTRTSLRVVCANTYNMASMEAEKSGRQFTFKHTANVRERIEEAKLALQGVRADHAAWVEMAEDLAKIRVDDHVLQMFVQQFIAMPPGDVVSDRVIANNDRARAAFTGLYLESPTTAGNRGTGLGLVNAAVEYLDHVRKFNSPYTYVKRTLLSPEPMKAKAVELVRELANAS